MRKPLHTAALAIVLATLTFAPGAFAANPPQAAANPPQQGATPPTAAGGHPVMHKALNQLQRVSEELQNDPSRDFGGHRADAIKLINQAIAQLQQGIGYANRH
jgi:hypothetical protein